MAEELGKVEEECEVVIGALNEVEPRTYRSGGNESWIDYYLVSKSLVDRGL